MAKQVKDESWLKQQLKEALHWDEDVAVGVLGLIVNAKRDEVQDITAAYMDNHPVAVCAISDFFDAKEGGKQKKQQPHQQQQPPHQQQGQQQQRSGAGAGSSYSSSVSAAAPQPSAAKQTEAAASKQQDKWLHLGAQPPAAAEPAPTPAADSVQQVSLIGSVVFPVCQPLFSSNRSHIKRHKNRGSMHTSMQVLPLAHIACPCSVLPHRYPAPAPPPPANPVQMHITPIAIMHSSICCMFQASSKKQAEATLAMFKRGGRLTNKPAGAAAAGGGGGGGTGRRKGGQLDSICSNLERKVANCLSCGKIFDCRNVTNDIIRFVGEHAAGGARNSCGHPATAATAAVK